MKMIQCENESAWLTERNKRVQASEAASILRLSPWGSPVEVAQRKLGLVPPLEKTDRMRWGSKLEPVIRQQLIENGMVIEYDGPHAIYAHDTHPLGASLDGRIGDSVLEIKCAGSNRGWEDGPPVHYQAQVQHQMFVTGMDRAVIAVLFAGSDLQTYEVKAHKAFQDMMVTQELAFWEAVQAGRLPAAESEQDIAALAKSMLVVKGKEVALPVEDFLYLHQQRCGLILAKKTIEKELGLIRDRILVGLGDAETGVIDGTDIRYSGKVVQKGEYTVKASSYRVVNSNKDNESRKKGAGDEP